MKRKFANGQKTYDLTRDHLTYFFKDGKVKAAGAYRNDKMEGEWKFYRITGDLWQVGNFENGDKHGSWIRYDKNGKPETEVKFEKGKKLKS
ncbi:hypothetical protein G3O08_06910 [Cryomorpha ignava]|uniref:Toxin-antitoxin system YwqK family antitoxin n=1 Tax=Cryomorpha ignava TaxID=101383 RepID=A0A7K3WNX4_9FLAO|nr:hypothetical protein [Cryomorpha ignava]NEN23228.1 hypothetical protein [Cryomorpha ignava]